MSGERRARILVADDVVEMGRLLADQLADAGYDVDVAAGGREALELCARLMPDLVITDLRMSEVDGFDVLASVQRTDPGVPVLIMTAFGAIDSAVDAIKRGAYHYLTKPFAFEEALIFVERALAEHRLRRENELFRRSAGERAGLAAMVGRSAALRALYDLVECVAVASAPVLVRGESGTGKELVARALHALGPRRARPFVAVNCTALPETLLESELFGHVRGAFSGATTARRGLFVEADGGTLFLDEIGDMPPALQSKLLRVLEDGEVRAVGADSARKVDVRIVAATHQALEERVRDGRFRADLFYRLNVVPIVTPPLRARAEDIPALAAHFLERARARNPGSRVRALSPELVAALTRRPWVGNVRELENAVERLVIVCPREVADVGDLDGAGGVVPAAAPLADGVEVLRERARRTLPTLRQLDDEYIAWVIEHFDGNKTRAAQALGIDVSTIHRRERDK